MAIQTIRRLYEFNIAFAEQLEPEGEKRIRKRGKQREKECGEEQAGSCSQSEL